MANAGRFHRCLEITFRDKTGTHTHKLNAGYGDDLDVYREHGETFVISRHRGLGYVSLEAFCGDAKIGDVFIEPHHVSETIGKENLAPFTIIRRLLDYI
jgi:hypothetical protein